MSDYTQIWPAVTTTDSLSNSLSGIYMLAKSTPVENEYESGKHTLIKSSFNPKDYKNGKTDILEILNAPLVNLGYSLRYDYRFINNIPFQSAFNRPEPTEDLLRRSKIKFSKSNSAPSIPEDAYVVRFFNLNFSELDNDPTTEEIVCKVKSESIPGDIFLNPRNVFSNKKNEICLLAKKNQIEYFRQNDLVASKIENVWQQVYPQKNTLK